MVGICFFFGCRQPPSSRPRVSIYYYVAVYNNNIIRECASINIPPVSRCPIRDRYEYKIWDTFFYFIDPMLNGLTYFIFTISRESE